MKDSDPSPSLFDFDPLNTLETRTYKSDALHDKLRKEIARLGGCSLGAANRLSLKITHSILANPLLAELFYSSNRHSVLLVNNPDAPVIPDDENGHSEKSVIPSPPCGKPVLPDPKK